MSSRTAAAHRAGSSGSDRSAGRPETLHAAVLGWYAENARDLPWRRPGTSPWAVLVSEVMLQQTPVERVRPVWQEWLHRWPTPVDLAAEPAGEAVRAWGRLGYPRRALRLHAAAAEITARHGGTVPSGYDELRALPGVGDYTAAAVASFAFGARHAVLDTNVRRVLARLLEGQAAAPAHPRSAERAAAEALLPPAADAPVWSVALMELGALVCTARRPACGACPVREACAWLACGQPPGEGPTRRSQPWEGTDRQARGRLLAVLRDRPDPVSRSELDVAWPDPVQRDRALHGLVVDGLVEALDEQRFGLPR